MIVPRRFKIVIVGPLPPPYTGMSVVTRMLASSFLGDEFDIIHLDTTDKRAIGNMGKLDFMNIVLGLKHSFQFFWLCLRNKPDMVYLPISQNFFGYLRDAFFLIPARIFDVKSIVHLHGGYFRKFYDNSSFLAKSIIGFSLRRTYAVVVLGECLRYIFEGLVQEKKIFVIPNGVDDYLVHSDLGPAPERPFRVLFLSNFLREKGLLEVLKAAALVVASRKNVKFVFAGEWNNNKDEEEAKELIKRDSLGPYVEFSGTVEKEAKKRLLNTSDVFVLPTSYPLEGQPLVILEALSAGLPVISTRKGAIAETITDRENGFLIEADNPRILSEKITELIENRQLRGDMKERNRELYLKKYTKDIFIKNLYDLFLKVAEQVLAGEKESSANGRQKVLVLGYLPPPQEGTAKMTEVIVNSEGLRGNFKIIFLSLLKRQYVTSRGKLGPVNIIYNLFNFLKYLYLIVRCNPGIIYMPLAQNKFGFLRDSLFILAGKVFGKRMCIHFHGGNFDQFYRMRNDAFKKYIRFVARRIDRLVLLADKFRNQFNSFIDNEKITFLYNCLLPGSSGDKKEIQEPSKPLKVLFVGYLSKAKGALDLVEAIPSVIAGYKGPVEFVLCGQPVDIERNIVFIPDPHFGYSKIMRIIKEKNLGPYVKIKKEVVTKEKTRVFSEADIFVFPSYSEGCGLVVLEAMSFGLPVVTTPVGALEEMMAEGANCFFVKPGDKAALSEKIITLLQNPSLRKEMGQANKQLISQEYTPEVFSRNISNIWADLAAKS